VDTLPYLNTPLARAHGGPLVNLLAGVADARAVRSASLRWPSWELTPRQLCDFELLVTGAFSPLRGFMTRRDYEAVCRDVRLADRSIWPIPIVLDVPEGVARTLGRDQRLALRDHEGVLLGALNVEDVWQPDRRAEAESIYGAATTAHAGVRQLLEETHPWYVGGTIQALQRPTHYDFTELRATPAQLRMEWSARGWKQVLAYQTGSPMHRADVALTTDALRTIEGGLLIQPVVGMTNPGDVNHYARVRSYQAVLSKYDRGTAKLALLPLARRMAGPREALWHAIIRKNYGCTHLMVGSEDVGQDLDASGSPVYSPNAAQDLLHDQQELGISIVPFREMAYVSENDRFYPEDQVPKRAVVSRLPAIEVRRRLEKGDALPEWFTYPEVIEQLRIAHPPRLEQGVTIFFTGLPGAGKSTIANVLRIRLLEHGSRPVTLLDGDLVRKHLSGELGFSQEHRALNVRRIGFVASEITRCGGMAICTQIAPYDDVRRAVRGMIEPVGGFCLVHVSTALEVCEQRDPKGLYAKARAGLISSFTGVSDPYETPDDADVVIDTTQMSAEAAAECIYQSLAARGYLVRRKPEAATGARRT